MSYAFSGTPAISEAIASSCSSRGVSVCGFMRSTPLRNTSYAANAGSAIMPASSLSSSVSSSGVRNAVFAPTSLQSVCARLFIAW